MKTIAFRMRVDEGCEAEYRRRHDAIWPELRSLLHDRGIRDYRIFLDPETRSLFAILQCPDETVLEGLAEAAVMRRWWAHMADIMETRDDGSPVTVPLQEVFHLP